jgi:hypothetical protein
MFKVKKKPAFVVIEATLGSTPAVAPPSPAGFDGPFD